MKKRNDLCFNVSLRPNSPGRSRIVRLTTTRAESARENRNLPTDRHLPLLVQRCVYVIAVSRISYRAEFIQITFPSVSSALHEITIAYRFHLVVRADILDGNLSRLFFLPFFLPPPPPVRCHAFRLAAARSIQTLISDIKNKGDRRVSSLLVRGANSVVVIPRLDFARFRRGRDERGARVRRNGCL